MQLQKNKVLLEKLRLGDPEAFSALYHEYHQPVFRNICKLIYDRAAAMDILQDVFLALWEHRLSIDTERSVGGWLFVVSYNKSVSYLKKSIRQAEALHRSALALQEQYEPEMEEEEFRYACHLKIVAEAIDKLPPQKRKAYCLCKLEGRSYKETGLILGISANTVKEYIKTSNKLLRRYASVNQEINLTASAGILLLLMY